MKKIISIMLVCVLGVSLMLPIAFAQEGGTRVFAITNPYETVDWDSWTAYKANRHTHSTASDAEIDLKDMVDAYYKEGFDVLAMTDHGIVNKGWNVKPERLPLLSLPVIKLPLTAVSQEDYVRYTTGSDRGGRGMLDVPLGIELNAGVLKKNHVNSYFVDYGQGDWGIENNYEKVIADVDKLGGLTQINHPGDWLGSGKDVNIAKDPANIRFFGDILVKYPSCMGIEVLNQDDSPTRHDRVLWDGLLEYTIPKGRNVWGLGTSDAHFMRHVISSYEYIMMPENTVENLRTAMENGTLFAVGLRARPELGNDFVGDQTIPVPMVTKVAVDQAAQTINLDVTAETKSVEWIAKGEIIATGNSINLSEHADEIGCYVRAQLKGDGGICFTQAFVCDDGNMQETKDTRSAIQKFFDNVKEKLIQNRLIAIILYIIDRLK